MLHTSLITPTESELAANYLQPTKDHLLVYFVTSAYNHIEKCSCITLIKDVIVINGCFVGIILSVNVIGHVRSTEFLLNERCARPRCFLVMNWYATTVHLTIVKLSDTSEIFCEQLITFFCLLNFCNILYPKSDSILKVKI